MEIFGNPVPARVMRKARRKREQYARRFGFDPDSRYKVRARPVPEMANLVDLESMVLDDETAAEIDPENAVAIATIRMGYGHYRIGLALASAAQSMGVRPYWLDLFAFGNTPAGRIVRHLESLYSLGSRLSRQFPLFDRFCWEPLTSTTFQGLAYNANDREMCSLMAPIFGELDPSLPVVSAHTWPAQAAVHAGMRRVVNAIPDNWPLGLHLAEGSLHAVQSPSTYLGYRMLKGMGRKGQILKPMPASALELTGHYVDHEMAVNLERDCAARIHRLEAGSPRRLLLPIGGAGAQGELAVSLVRSLAGPIRDGAATLLVNTGDHQTVLDLLTREFHPLGLEPAIHTDWNETQRFARDALTGPVSGIHLFYHPNIFPAVYTTNLLLRACDVLVTKPSELAYYPVPKLFLRRVGGHEAWGAIRSAELGDGTLEFESTGQLLQALELLIEDGDLLRAYCESIVRNHRSGIYRGAYRVIERALEKPFGPLR